MNSDRKTKGMGVAGGLGLFGIALGAAFGAAFDDIGVGVALVGIGVAIGVVIGGVVDSVRSPRNRLHAPKLPPPENL